MTARGAGRLIGVGIPDRKMQNQPRGARALTGYFSVKGNCGRQGCLLAASLRGDPGSQRKSKKYTTSTKVSYGMKHTRSQRKEDSGNIGTPNKRKEQ